MGTSKSYGGPTDVSRLLPSWALPGAAPSQQDPAASPPDPGAPPAAGAGDSAAPAEAAPAPSLPAAGTAGVPALPAPTPKRHTWRSARQSLGAAVSGASGSRSYARAGKAYVRARGGARSAARAAATGSRATARLAGFLANVASVGGAQATERIGLAPLAGKSADEVLSALTNALAPAGATLDDAVARQAVAETLAELYEKRGADERGLESLEKMSPDDIRAVIGDSVSSYVFYRWVQELGLAIEKKAVSAKEAVVIEREMRTYIRETVKLDLTGRDVLQIDWHGAEGLKVIEDVFTEAYGLLEAVL